MAKELLVKLTCDYHGCRDKVTLPADPNRPPTEEAQRIMSHWVQLLFSDGSIHQFCRTGCAINFLREKSDIVLTDPGEDVAKVEVIGHEGAVAA